MLSYHNAATQDAIWGQRSWSAGTYVSTTSFTVVSDQRAAYAVGAAVQILQSGVVKSAHVLTSTFAAGVTTVTIEAATIAVGSLTVRPSPLGATNHAVGKTFLQATILGAFVAGGIATFNGAATFNAATTITGATPALTLTDTTDSTTSRIQQSGGALRLQGVVAGTIRLEGFAGGNIGSVIVRFAGADRTLWHTGNFDPTQYARLDGATFTGPVLFSNGADAALQGGALTILKGPTSTLVGTNVVVDVTGTSVRFSEAGGTKRGFSMDLLTGAAAGAGTIWNSGNFDPTQYARLDGATFTGNVGITKTYPVFVLNDTSSNVNDPTISFARQGVNKVQILSSSSGNFAIVRLDQTTGAYAAQPFQMNLTTGRISINEGLAVVGSASFSAAVTMASTLAVTGNVSSVGLFSSTGTGVASHTGSFNYGGSGIVSQGFTVGGFCSVATGLNVSGGNVTAVGDVSATGTIRGARVFTNGTFVELGQGSTMTWNQSQSLGESCFLNNRGGGSGGFDFYIGTGGSYTKRFAILSNGDAQSLSDERHKEGFEELSHLEARHFVQGVKSGFFRWRDTQELDVGVYAQQAEAYAPLLVKRGIDADQTRTFSYQKMGVYHQAAISGLYDEVDELKEKLVDAGQRIKVLEQRVLNAPGGV